MDEQRKSAYRHLLCWALLDIRQIQYLGFHGWRAWNPFYWRQQARRVQYAGAVADWLHNLAEYSAYNFRKFDEEWFWKEFETTRSRYSEFGMEHYRSEFDRYVSATGHGPGV